MGILQPEEYDSLVDQGLLRSESDSSIASDVSSGQLNYRMSAPRRKEVYVSGSGSGLRSLEPMQQIAGALRPNQVGGVKTHNGKALNSKGKIDLCGGSQELHEITNIPENDRATVSSDSDDTESESSEPVSNTAPHVLLPQLKDKNQHHGRNSFSRAPAISNPNAQLVSKTPPPASKSSFEKPVHKGRKVVVPTSTKNVVTNKNKH